MVEESRVISQRYVVGELIGRGGMADVYRGTDSTLGRTVAIKLLKKDFAGDPVFRQRFRQEAQAASRMAHPTIVRVYDAGEEETVDAEGHRILEPFIIMEYVSGRTLKSVLSEEGALPPARAQRITEKLLTALEYSHRAGVVHRDIKPGNIMLTEGDGVKVMDFGIARAVSDSSATVAQTTAILGTASYFSPEQAKGEIVDARTDLYSTGVVLFEMLTGRAPFRGDTAVAVAYQHVSEAPAVPSSINPAVPEGFDHVVARALAKNRDDRYQSAADFRDDVQRAGAGLPVAGPVVEDATTVLFGAAGPVQTSTEQALRQLTSTDGPVRTQRRPPVVWIWAGVAVVAVVLIAVMVWVVSLTSVPSLADQTRDVPNLVGMTQENAIETLHGLDLVESVQEEPSDTVEKGDVIRTDPGAGTQLKLNSVVEIFVSTGAETVTVPSIVNMKQEDAEAALEKVGLALGEITQQESPTLAAGTIVSSTPAALSPVAPGSRVNITVSNGKVLLTDIRGQSMSAATSTLQDLGLKIEPTADATCPAVSGDSIVSQSVAPGLVDQNSAVPVTYCSGSPVSTETPADTPPAIEGE